MPNEDDIEVLQEVLDTLQPEVKPEAKPAPAAEDEGDDIAAMLDALPAVAAAPAPAAAAPPVAEDDIADMLDAVPATPVVPRPAPLPTRNEDDGGDDIASFIADSGIKQERDVPDITKPWMKYHKFVRVQTVEEVVQIVDAALAHGRCALDLETQGLDNRIEWDAEGKPHTVHKVVGYCISVDGETGYYIPVRHKASDGGPDLNVPVEGVDEQIKRLCVASQPIGTEESIAKDPLSFKEFSQPPKCIIYFWNAQFDQEFLFPITGIDWWHPESYEDGMLACFCKYAADKALGLKYKAPELLRSPGGDAYVMTELKELFIKGRPIDFASLSPDEDGVVKYGGSDGICTYLLCEPPRAHEKGRPDILKLAKTKYAFTYRLEKQVSQAVRIMERPRVRINRERVRELLAEHEKERTEILTKIQDFASQKGWHNLDPNSPKQLSDFLFGDGPNCLNITVPASNDFPGGKPPVNEKSKQYKTDADTLESMVEGNPHAPPVLKWIVEFRGVEKIIGTYLQHMVNNPDKNDEMRFSFKQTGAGTGRFSAPANADKVDHGFSGIPIHGIPGESSLRKVFVAREGYTMAKCDYAGQELRIAANVSGEPVWIKEFSEGSGDLHSITARAFFNKVEVTKDERKMGKIANFALIYGGGPAAIMRATGCDKVEGSRRKQAFDKSVPVFASWIKKQHATVKKEEGVWTAFGRWLAVPDANHPDRAVQAACERYSTNYPIQGSGADIMKISMVLLVKEFYKRGWLKSSGDDSVRMLLTVHDELVFEIKHERVVEVIPLIVKVMESPTHMARPAWKVPLVVEPLIGPNWGSGFKCEHAKKDHKLNDDEVLVGGFIYGTTRKAEKGDRAGLGEIEEKKGDNTYIRQTDPAWLRNVSREPVEAQAAETSEEAPPEAQAAPQAASPPVEAPKDTPPAAPPPDAPAAPPAPPPAAAVPAEILAAVPPPAPKPKTNGKGHTVTMKINRLNRLTVRQVRRACFDAWQADGRLLRLTDGIGVVLVDPMLGIRVDPERLATELFSLNLSDGEYSEEP